MPMPTLSGGECTVIIAIIITKKSSAALYLVFSQPNHCQQWISACEETRSLET